MGASVGWIGGLAFAAASTLLIGLQEWWTMQGPGKNWIVAWNIVSVFLAFALSGVLAAQTRRLTRYLAQMVDERTTQWKAETERYRAAAEGLRSQSLLLENMAEGMIVTDDRGHIELANAAACRLTGFEETDLVGQPITLLSPLPAAETRQTFEEVAAAVSKEGKWFGDLPVRREDHTVMLAQVVLTRVEYERRVRIIALGQDITAKRQAELNLRAREEQLRLGLDAASMATWELEIPSGRIHYSGGIQSFFGEDPIAAYSSIKSILEAIHPEDRPLASQRLELAIAGKAVLDHEYRIRRRDGTYRWILVKGQAALSLEKAPTRLLGIAMDITERKRAEAVLQVQRDLGVSLSLAGDLHAGLDRLLDIALKLDGIDSGGVYLTDAGTGDLHLASHRGLSRSFVEHVAYYPANHERARLIGKKAPLYTNYSDLPKQPDLPLAAERLRAIAVVPLVHEGKVLGALNLASHERDEIPLQNRFVIETIAAQATGVLARLRTEAALHESEARLRVIINTAPLVLFAVDKDGIILFEDGQALKALGTRPEDFVGRGVREVFRDHPQVLDDTRRALAGEQFSTLSRLGDLVFDCTYCPTRDREGNVSGYLGVATNITERRRLEQQLLDISDREQARIGQEIHDSLCQQLVGLAFDANALQAQLSKGQRGDADLAARLAHYLDLAITEARQLSRGLFPIRLETDGLPSALEELANTITLRFKICCEFEQSDAPPIRNGGVATHLYRITQEAVNNALKHSHASRIRIRLAECPAGLELSVQDNGAGLLPGARSQTKGLGLHIMDYRARAIGATLELGSNPAGGTVVSCCIPRRML